MRWTASPQQHRNVPILDSDGPTASAILAFAERLLLANNGHERAFRLRPLYTRKRTSWAEMFLTLLDTGAFEGAATWPNTP